jgi:hypothetical protein
MARDNLSALERAVVAVLKASNGPVTIPRIEARLAGKVEADTFDVRDTVWRLIERGLAKFTQYREVTIARK